MKSVMVLCAILLAVSARGGQGVMEAAPLWDLERDAGDVTAAVKRDGFIPLDAAHAFDIPHTAVKDSTAFTVEMKIRCMEPEDNTRIHLLRQRTADTGWSLEAFLYPRVGSPISLGMNDASFNAGWFRTQTNQVHTFTVTARKGLVAVYWNGRVLKRYFGQITPNLEPVKVGVGSGKQMPGVRLESLKFWGPEEEFYAKGESKDFAEGFRGGPGWAVSCPTEKPEVNLPRILCYGDSILSGYGPRLRNQSAGKAYVYTWSGFVSDPRPDKVNRKTFVSASSVAPFDIIVFNNGLHSLHWSEDKVKDADIKEIVRNILNGFRAGAPKAKIYWLATTPQTSREKNAAGKVEKMGDLNPIVLRINRLAAEVMAEEKIPVIDGYTLLAAQLEHASGDGYHWRPPAYDLLAKTVCETVLGK